jgi:ABC-type glycerol-3-phosphate transport system substrate-binding protein
MRIRNTALSLLLLAMVAGCGKKEAPGLRFRYWGDTSEIAIIEQTIKDFEAENPGIKVRAERKPPDATYAALLITELAAGKVPDVIFLGDGNCDQLIKAGCFLPLDPLIAVDPEIKKEAYYPAMVERFSNEGTLYLLPRDIAPVDCIYYNKKLFDQVKLAYPKDNWTWKEFKEMAIKLTNPKAEGGAVFGYADEWPGVEPYIFSSGGTLVDNTKKPTRITMDSPKALRGIRFRMELLHTLKIIPSTGDTVTLTGGNEAMFTNGKLAMLYSGIWKTPLFRKIKDFDWDIAPFPAGPDGNREAMIGGSGYGIAKMCKDPAAAWKLVRYLAGEKGQRMLASTGLAQPAIKALAESSAFLDGQRPLNKKMLLKAALHGYTAPALEHWSEFYDGTWRPKIEQVWVTGFKGDMEALVHQAVEEGNKKMFAK